jgi:hypothetical protein
MEFVMDSKKTIIFWRLDPKYLPLKYQLENEITLFFIKKYFSNCSIKYKIKYIQPKYNLKKFKKVDPRWNKLLTLIDFYFSDNYKNYKNFKNIYIDHDGIISPNLFNTKNTTLNVFFSKSKRLPAGIIDFNFIPFFRKKINIQILKKQEIYEEYLFRDILNELKTKFNINYIPLHINKIHKEGFFIHWSATFLYKEFVRLFNKNEINKESFKYYINILKNLNSIYQKEYNDLFNLRTDSSKI